MAKSAKKAAKKSTVKKARGPRSESISEKAVQLMLRKAGATLAELVEIGHIRPAMAAVKAAISRGYKTKVEHPEGDVKHYYAIKTNGNGGAAPKAKKAVARKAAKKKVSKPRKPKAVKAPEAAQDHPGE